MSDRSDSQAVVVGSGPNGLAAAIALAEVGLSVIVLEANETLGGGARSAQVTLPGFMHDLCSAVHPMACGSPFFRQLPLARYGLDWVHPDAPLAHPLDDGTAVMLERSITETAQGLGADARAYLRLMNPLVQRWEELLSMILRPVLRLPRYPFLLARFGVFALLPARRLTSLFFKRQPSRALFAGIAAHSMLSLDAFLSGSFGLILGLLGHAVGWPLARGGSQRISDALAGHLGALGGRIRLNTSVDSIDALSSGRPMILDVTPRQLLGIGGDHLPSRFQDRLRRHRYGPGAFKLDYALDAPVPWRARACRRAGTVHVGGTLAEIAASENCVAKGEIPEHPFVLVAQPSLFDPTRAPEGKHVLWAYCHVPNGASEDMTERIEAQIERFAPGFRDRILERRATGPSELERSNANYVGGDINGGVLDVRQSITRPTFRRDPYSTPVRGLYLCSASTPPGGGVHGMCGYNAALSVLHAGADIIGATHPGS